MGAPISIGGNWDIWVSNGTKDLFCEVVVEVALLGGQDVSYVYETAPGIAGTYGVSGLGIEVEGFYPYFGGAEGFRRHLDTCSRRCSEVCDNERAERTMEHVIAWVQFVLDGGVITGEPNFYDESPPAR
jgi:hypothetical protein